MLKLNKNISIFTIIMGLTKSKLYTISFHEQERYYTLSVKHKYRDRLPTLFKEYAFVTKKKRMLEKQGNTKKANNLNKTLERYHREVENYVVSKNFKRFTKKRIYAIAAYFGPL